VVPDHVHVLFQGRIVKSGGKELAFELEQRGYGWLEAEAVGSPLPSPGATAK
jgi:Fe-S cluster assembly ATP-binding protein